jgi:uncharacterized protein (DUF2141 family)
MRSISFIILFFLSLSIFSQNDDHRTCGYDEWLQAYEEANPGYTEMIQQGLKDFATKKISEKRSSALVIIPVHVILVHAPGQAEGSGTNFTLAHVQSQIDVLNQDFGFYNADASGVPPQFPAGDTGIQFCLATVDPNGAATDGITRFATNTSMANNSGRTEVISQTKWPREDYMNIWSAPNLPFLGLATVPGTGGLPNSNQDFVLVAASTFGGPGFGTDTPYDLGRTTTHEVGHWLGLSHIWGGGCSSDDGIADTPDQSGSNFGCPNHPSPSCGNSGDMFMNYMDYTNDACMFSFSIGQGEYMNTILSTSRASLQGSSATACAFSVPLSVAVISQQDPSCFDSSDGFILVEAEGGSPDYTYAIDGSTPTSDGLFTDLAGGTHFIEVFDNDGISTSITVFLNTPDLLVGTAEITATNPCSNQSMAAITIEVSGGTNPYFFSLNMGQNQQTNTFDELPNGNYVYLITDNNGCTSEGTIEISGEDDIAISIDIEQDVTCNGTADGTIALSATGGNGDLTYMIDGEDNQDQGVFVDLTSGEYLIYVTDEAGCYDSITVSIDEPTEVVVSATITDVSCNGDTDGQLTLSAQGGNGSEYTYSVNGIIQESSDFSSLSAGEYSIQAIDEMGCQSTDLVTISEPEPLVVEILSIENISCLNPTSGSIELSVSGGFGSYMFLLDNAPIPSTSIQGLAEGNYTFNIIDDNNCNQDIEFEIISEPLVQIEIAVQDIACQGLANGSIQINSSNTTGTPIYSINGSAPQSEDTFLNLEPGDYTVMVTDENGCTAETSATITEPNALHLSVDDISDVSCFGGNDGQATFNAAGGTAPYFYQYDLDNTNPDGLIAGLYNLSVTDDNGCVTTTQFEINEPTELQVEFTNDGSEVKINGSGGVQPYQYSFDEGSFSDDNTTESSSDNISASIQDANGCISTIEIVMSNISELAADWEVNAYPVPMTDALILDFNFNKSLNASIQIFDIQGKLVNNIPTQNYQSGENSVKIDVRNFARSIYIVKIASAEGYRYIKVTKM